MNIEGIYTTMYTGIHWLDIVGLAWIAQLLAAQYKSLAGIMETVAWICLQLPPLLCSQLVHQLEWVVAWGIIASAVDLGAYVCLLLTLNTYCRASVLGQGKKHKQDWLIAKAVRRAYLELFITIHWECWPVVCLAGWVWIMALIWEVQTGYHHYASLLLVRGNP